MQLYTLDELVFAADTDDLISRLRLKPGTPHAQRLRLVPLQDRARKKRQPLGFALVGGRVGCQRDAFRVLRRYR